MKTTTLARSKHIQTNLLYDTRGCRGGGGGIKGLGGVGNNRLCSFIQHRNGGDPPLLLLPA